MRKLIMFTMLLIVSFVVIGQPVNRLRIHSGLTMNLVINGADTSIFGWKADRYTFGTYGRPLEIIVGNYRSGLIDTAAWTLDASGNTYFGYRSGQNDVGNSNTFMGCHAGRSNTTGFANVAIGSRAMMKSTVGRYNIAIGDMALRENNGNGFNVAIGQAAMALSVDGNMNTAVGEDAMAFSTTGNSNTAIGAAVLLNNKGYGNTALGQWTGYNNKSGNYNLFLGFSAGYYGTWTGKGFIDVYGRGDSASQLTSSPIVIDFNVDPSLQKVKFNATLVINNLNFGTDSIVLADDDSVKFTAGIYGWGIVYVYNAGVKEAKANFDFQADGTVTLETSLNTEITNTDGKLCIVDGGSYFYIKNRLGGSRTIKYEIKH